MLSFKSKFDAWKPHLLAFTLLCSISFLAADLSEESASSIALSGITALSDSPADQLLSPLIRNKGVSFNYHSPFGQKDAQVWGLHYATEYQILHTGFGSSWLNHADYNYRDYYLNANLGYEGIVLGYTQHLIHESFSSSESYHKWRGDVGVASNNGVYGAEIRWLRMGSRDAQWHFSSIYHFAPGCASALDYVYMPRGADSYRSGISLAAGELLSFAASWQSEPSRFGFGIQLDYGSMTLMYAVRTHLELNADHSLELGFRW